MVNREPYCLWDTDLIGRSREFLKGLDPEFFEYSLNVHLEARDQQRASVALRLALHHALETLFSLLGAYIQAPDLVGPSRSLRIGQRSEKICQPASALHIDQP